MPLHSLSKDCKQESIVCISAANPNHMCRRTWQHPSTCLYSAALALSRPLAWIEPSLRPEYPLVHLQTSRKYLKANEFI